MENKEQLPATVISKVLGGKDIRVVIAEHPVTKEMAPCVPYLDYARAFTYDEATIFKLINRSNWIKRYIVTAIMEVASNASDGRGGGYLKTLCLFEEGALGLFFKLQPSRCKDPDVAARVDQLQEELILVLRDALRGFRTGHAGFDYRGMNGKLPNPGLSMEAVADLCKEADKYLRGKASLRALNFFTGMPVDDLVTEIDLPEPGSSQVAGLIVQYLHALMEGDPSRFGIEKGVTEDGAEYLQAVPEQFFNAFSIISRELKLPKFFKSLVQFGQSMAREAAALELLGWRRSLAKLTRGQRFFRYELLKETVH